MRLSKIVLEYMEEKADEMRNDFYESLDVRLGRYWIREINPMISPMEQLFFIEWYSQFYHGNLINFELKPQYQDNSTGKYIIDFRINLLGYLPKKYPEMLLNQTPEPKIGIEIDGHIWHEKTKEQVRKDKERERFLVSNGWRLLRFSGSEIHKNPENCIEETGSFSLDIAHDWYKELEKSLNIGYKHG